MASSPPPTTTTTSRRPPRPVLDPSTRTLSFLSEHAQYRPPAPAVDGHNQGIDSIVESSPPAAALTKPFVPYTGVPSARAASPPPRIVDSGISHSLSHATCQPAPGAAVPRVIATLFYKSNSRRASAPPSRAPSPPRGVPAADINAPADGTSPAAAAGSSSSSSPLEPPPPDDSEPLDHLYGSFISPLCLTAFLALLSSLPLPRGHTHVTSSHRCLDVPTASHARVVELTFSPAPDPAYLTLDDLRRHELLYRFERAWNVDVVLQHDTPLRRYPRLVVFDMDSTLITQEVIDLIAASVGPAAVAEVSAITERAMNGELDFAASLRARALLLRGAPASVFESLKPVLDVTQGVVPLLRALKRLGVKTAVLSGGFAPLTSHLAQRLGIDHAHANTLRIADNSLTGEVEGRIVDAAAKAAYLLEIAAAEGVDLSQVVAVGDGANDLLMMKEAGLGVAWRAKRRVQMEAGARLNGESMLDLMYLFGFTREEVGVLSA